MIESKVWKDAGKAHIILKEGDTGEHWEFDEPGLDVLKWTLALDEERLGLVRRSVKALETL